MDEFEMETTQEQEAADRLEQQRQQRREAAKRFRDRKAAEKAERSQLAKAMKYDIVAAGVYDRLSDNIKAFIEELISGGPARSNTPMFNVIFGASPKVGDSMTLSEIFNKTLKGKSAIDAYVKKWAEQGIVVEFSKNAANILDSTYTVKSL